MAFDKYQNDDSYAAGADLTTEQYKIVELASANTVTVCNNAGDVPVGVLQNDPNSGQAATVRKEGMTKCVSDGSGTAIVVNDPVGTNNAGKAVKKTANNDYIIGRAMSASSADGVIITVDMTYRGQLGA